MKKVFLLLIITLTLASCTSTMNVTSFEQYNRNIEIVKSDLAGKGYTLSGHNQESSSNTVVTGVSYSTYTGYGTAMDNDHYTYDTYTFSNANGDFAEISLKYRGRYSSYSDMNYMQTVELLGCKTSKSSDYNKICGYDSAVKPYLSNMYKDANVEVYDESKTCVLILLLSCTPLLFLL
ncbi:MAG: hypothetical protein II300_06305 [Bacteroidales bacterium]|nr:hypothetical protein [Bacteroidales bacterium]